MFSRVFGIGPPEIASANYATDKNVENKHKRFGKLLEKEGRSADQGIRFLVNQLAVNKSVYDAIFSKSRLTETDRTHIDLFYNPIKGLFNVLIPDAQSSLRNELYNYNEFLRIFYKTKLREKIHALAQYERQQTRAAKKNTRTFADTKTKFMKLGMTDAQANAEIAKTTAFAKAFVPNVAPVNPVEDAAINARVDAALKDLLAKMDTLPVRSDILRATRAAKTALATAMATAMTTAMTTAMNQSYQTQNAVGIESQSDVNAYLANLEARQFANMAARMPAVPTTVPRVGGARTRRHRKSLRKTRRNMRRA